jgi:hypothetical protein
VGDRILVRFVDRNLSAVVVEDRGNIGVGGRQLIRIRARLDQTDPESEVTYEVPAEEVRFASNGRKPNRKVASA